MPTKKRNGRMAVLTLQSSKGWFLQHACALDVQLDTCLRVCVRVVLCQALAGRLAALVRLAAAAVAAAQDATAGTASVQAIRP
jgi:hypothetical protein